MQKIKKIHAAKLRIKQVMKKMCHRVSLGDPGKGKKTNDSTPIADEVAVRPTFSSTYGVTHTDSESAKAAPLEAAVEDEVGFRSRPVGVFAKLGKIAESHGETIADPVYGPLFQESRSVLKTQAYVNEIIWLEDTGKVKAR